MRYSFVLATLGAGAAMAALQPVGQISDGQIQVSTGAVAPPSPVTSAPVEEETVYSTKHIVITSCPPEVISCPAESIKTTSTVVPVVSTPKAVSTPPAVSLPNVSAFCRVREWSREYMETVMLTYS